MLFGTIPFSPIDIHYDKHYQNITTTGLYTYNYTALPNNKIILINNVDFLIVFGACSFIDVLINPDAILLIARKANPVINEGYNFYPNIYITSDKNITFRANVTTQPCGFYTYMQYLTLY